MDLQKARQLLATGEYTCVLCREDTVITSTRRGVAPLMALLDAGTDIQGFCAADKVVGKATALLYCVLGVQAVYSDVISQSALQVLSDHGIRVQYGKCVDFIQNRSGTGRCPMELATASISKPEAAPAAIRLALEKLQKEK